jgi:glycosyltransferase involved in cell wall biosynthesis
MASFDISVIVPTYNRRDLLADLLTSLATQTLVADRWELIVVDDGSTDGTPEMLERAARGWPTSFTRLHRHHLRAASVRNAGAERASGRVLLFVDDDMVATPELVAAHRQCHTDERLAVIGRIIAPAERRDPWTTWDDAQLALLADSLQGGQRAPGPRDFYSGNCSIVAELFRSVGGFNASMERAEDFDMGYRLTAGGTRLVYCEAATSVHRGMHNFENWVNNAAAFGRSEVELAQEFSHGSDFLAWYRSRHLLNRLLVRLCNRYPILSAPLVASMDRVGRLADAAGATAVCSAAYSAIYNLSYWQGLIGAFGSEGFWRDVNQRPAKRSLRSFQ